MNETSGRAGIIRARDDASSVDKLVSRPFTCSTFPGSPYSSFFACVGRHQDHRHRHHRHHDQTHTPLATRPHHAHCYRGVPVAPSLPERAIAIECPDAGYGQCHIFSFMTAYTGGNLALTFDFAMLPSLGSFGA